MERTALAARALTALAALPALLAGLAAWRLQGTFPVQDAGWLGSVLPGLVVLGVGLGAAFSPWDRPTGAWAWSAPLEGLACGLACFGLLVFPHSFLVLGPLLGAWAWGLSAAAAVLVAPEVVPEATERRLRTRRLLRALGASCALGLILLWRAPPGGPRPLALGSPPPPVALPPAERVDQGRVRREDDKVRVSGEGVELTLRLDRPALDVEIDGQKVHLEPCLYVEEGASDGFFPLGALNRYAAEPRGMARCEWVEGERRAWIRAEWPRGGSFGRRSLGTSLLGWGLHLVEGLSARVEVEVDLAGERLVRVDALTRLGRALDVHRATLGWVRIAAPGPAPQLSWGLEGELLARPPARDEGAPAELLARELDLVRQLRARRGERGPWEVLAQGRFEDWACLSQGERRLVVVLPDWAAQAGLEPSPSAGQGVAMNGLHYWREAGQVNLLLDLGSSRLGAGPRATRLPPGMYRDRISLLGLHPEASTRGKALRERTRLLEGS